jgi:hypothetical protein
MQKEFTKAVLKIAETSLKLSPENKKAKKELLISLSLLCKLFNAKLEDTLKMLSLLTISENFCQAVKNLFDIPPFLSDKWFKKRKENALIKKIEKFPLTEEDLLRQCLKENKLSEKAKLFAKIILSGKTLVIYKGKVRIVFNQLDEYDDFKEIVEIFLERKRKLKFSFENTKG